MAKEKAKHDGLLCFLLAVIVVLILVIGGGAYYFLVVDNGEEITENENITNIEVSTNNEDTDKNTELNVEDEFVKDLYSFIPTLRFNRFMPTAYQTNKVTFNDLQNEVKLINIFNHIDFGKENVVITEGNYSKENMLANWFKFSGTILERYAKEFYGENATINHERFESYYGAGCNYNNGEYSYGFGRKRNFARTNITDNKSRKKQ